MNEIKKLREENARLLKLVKEQEAIIRERTTQAEKKEDQIEEMVRLSDVALHRVESYVSEINQERKTGTINANANKLAKAEERRKKIAKYLKKNPALIEYSRPKLIKHLLRKLKLKMDPKTVSNDLKTPLLKKFLEKR